MRCCQSEVPLKRTKHKTPDQGKNLMWILVPKLLVNEYLKWGLMAGLPTMGGAGQVMELSGSPKISLKATFHQGVEAIN